MREAKRPRVRSYEATTLAMLGSDMSKDVGCVTSAPKMIKGREPTTGTTMSVSPASCFFFFFLVFGVGGGLCGA
jgi:hypothetical protein